MSCSTMTRLQLSPVKITALSRDMCMLVPRCIRLTAIAPNVPLAGAVLPSTLGCEQLLIDEQISC